MYCFSFYEAQGLPRSAAPLDARFGKRFRGVADTVFYPLGGEVGGTIKVEKVEGRKRQEVSRDCIGGRRVSVSLGDV